MAVNLGTRGVDAARDLVEYCNHPSGTVLVGPAACATAPPSRTTSSCGAWATRWTARGRSATRPPRSTAGSPPRPPRRCAWSTRRIELVACGSSQPAHADVRHVGGDRPGGDATTSSTTSRCTLLRGARRRPGQLPGLRRRHGPLHRGRGRDLRPRPARRAGTRKRINLSFDEWNVWYQSRFAGEDEPRLGARRRGCIEDMYSRDRRGRRRQPADHAAAARRPGQDRLPGPAGQRDRADPRPSRAARPGGRRSSTRSR